MTDNKKNLKGRIDAFKKLHGLQSILQKVDAGNYAKDVELLVSGSAKDVKNTNFQKEKTMKNEKNPFDSIVAGTGKELGATVAAKGYSKEMDSLFATPIKLQTKQRA